MRRRVNNITKEKRIRQIMDLIGQGLYTCDIVAQLSKEWKCQERAVYKYLDIVRKIVSKEIDSQDVNNMITRLDYLYKLAVARGDHRLAAHIEISKGKLTVGEKQKVEHTGNVSSINIIVNGTKPTSNGNISE